MRFPLHPYALRDGRRGFALLITITLLAFLVLLLVSLASLTRVETQVAANNQQLAQARQNALLGLNIALGRLQALAGPDQRVTGTADLVTGRHDTKKHWTGVWDGAYDINPASASFQNPRGWLVSGAAANGSAGVTAELAAGSADTSLVELVGGNTTDTTDPALAPNAVSVETEPIKSDSVPGLISGTPVTIGNFAYWIGDEGVKANAALVDPYAASSHPQHGYSLIAAQRNAIERVETQVAEMPATPSPLAGNYPANNALLSKVISAAQFPLIQSDPTAQAILRSTARTRFHDLTTRSASVPVDVARGGLKRDLTAWLRGTPVGAAETDTALIYDPGIDPTLIGDPDATGLDPYGLPRWGIIRTYANTTDDGTPKPVLPTVNDATLAQNGLFPVITHYSLGINISCAGDDQPLVIHTYPLVVLWNPYNVPIAATRYEADFSFNATADAVFRWQVGDDSGRVISSLNLNTTTTSGSGSLYRYWRFQLAPTVIPPGASLVFTLGSTAAYDPDSGANVLVHAADSGYSATIATDAPLTAAERAQGVRWSWNAGWSTGGGQYHTVLRTVTAAPGPLTPVDFKPLPLLSGELQASRRMGYGLGFAPFTSNPVPTSPLDAAVQFRSTARMGSGNLRKPRWITQHNLRGNLAYSVRYFEDTPTPLYSGDAIAGGTPLSFDGIYASAGKSVSSTTRTDLALAAFQPAGMPLFSLAQLQHANLSLAHASPSYAVGNSLAHPIIPLDKTFVNLTKAPAVAEAPLNAFYDQSYLLNRELWDRYFFSTVPATLTVGQLEDTAFHLPNTRHVFNRESGNPPLAEVSGADAFRRSASHLLVNGGFNVNSTSWQAWRTLLSCHVGLVTSGSFQHVFNRNTALAGAPNDLWGGYRVLSDAQVDRLAWNIVREIKTRGPFLSLADFVNRRLLADAAQVTGYKGVIQAAIDTTDTETTIGGGPPLAPINTNPALTSTATTDMCEALSTPTATSKIKYDPQRYQGGPTRQAPYASRIAFAPGYLTQADLLTALGSVLTARSDTFVIRAYGDVKNPITSTIEGKAWCEAVVQRLPAYVESGVNPWDTPAAGSDSEKFGRRFKVISFRWLNPSDI